MRVTMVKKELASGEPCKKCEQAVELFKRRGVFHRIDEISVAREADPESPGMLLAKKHNVAAYNWGLVAGKTQTHLPWDSWQRPYTDREPPVWFHEVFRADGSPYRAGEVELIRTLTAR